MTDNDNTQCLQIKGGGGSSTGATNRNKEKLKRSRSKKVSKIVGKDGDNNETQQTPTPSNGSKKTGESKKKKDTPRKASTLTRKRRKTSSDKSEGCASSSRVAEYIAPSDFGQTKVTTLQENKIKEKPKPKRKPKKKEVNKNRKQKQGEATPTYQPRQFIGLYVCREHNGARSLGTVSSYDPKTKLFKIGYDDDDTENIEQNEVLKSMATAKDISEARQALLSSSKKTSGEEGQKATLSEEE